MRLFSLFVLAFAISCSSKKVALLPAENAFDAGREFIDGNLKGDFQKAAFYMIADEQNKQFLSVAETINLKAEMRESRSGLIG